MGLGTALGTYRYNQYGSASGGTSSSITSSGVSYTLLTFTTDGTLTVSKDGLFDVLLVGGGGNGGNTITNERAGGGGGGGVINRTIYLAAGSYTVAIGAGATGNIARCGGSTRLGSASAARTDLVAVGGGQGGGYRDGTSGGNIFMAWPGGCGGGSSVGGGWASTGALGLQGNAGGNATATFNQGCGGGGGGNAVGADGTSTAGGNGGQGFDASDFLGQSAGTTRLAGGGGGGGPTTNGTGGAGGGGNGGNNNGTANTGGGGGGGSGGNGGAGGSGIVYVRFKI